MVSSTARHTHVATAAALQAKQYPSWMYANDVVILALNELDDAGHGLLVKELDARIANLSRATINTALSRLQDLGLVKRTSVGYRARWTRTLHQQNAPY